MASHWLQADLEELEEGGQGEGQHKSMTCIDDDANSHLRVSDGTASKQKTLAAKACPCLVRMLPGDEEIPGVVWWPRHAITG